MKRLASFLLTLTMLFGLTACGGGGLDLNKGKDSDSSESQTPGEAQSAEPEATPAPEANDDDPGVEFGYIGDTLSTEWFDFVVEDAYSCSEYNGYTPQEGYKLVVATISLKNTWGASVDMWGDDFVIIWGNSDEDLSYDIPIAAGYSDEQFPDEYVLGINASKTGVSVYEVPEDYRDFSIWFMELFESNDNPDGDKGKDYFVDFTAEAR